jgi:hypothetical protein
MTKRDTEELSLFSGRFNMSMIGSLRQAQIASQSLRVVRPENSNLNVADHLRIRQMERMLEQTLEELAQVRGRVDELEKLVAQYAEHEVVLGKSDEGTIPLPAKPPLPVDEIKELAEMAKRFK